MTPYIYRAELVRVIDGDTAEFDIDLGFKIWIRRKVRIDGFDAPERRSPKGPAASKGLEQLLTFDGPEILLAPAKEGALMSFSRIVSRVFVDGRDVAEIMTEAGFVKGGN